MIASDQVPLYVTHPAAVVRKAGGRIVVEVNGAVVASAPLRRLSEVVLVGPADVSSRALGALLDATVPLVLLRSDGRARGRLEPVGSPHVALRRQQLRRLDDVAWRHRCALEVVLAKLHNQRVAVLRLGRSRATPSRQRADLADAAEAIAQIASRAKDAETVAQLVGHEGAAAARYFGAYRLAYGERYGFVARSRTATDLINCAINYCSALLREAVVGSLCQVGLDPHVSFFHEPMRNRPTLAFDLMEEWRPALLEMTVFSAAGLGMITLADVDSGEPGRLSASGRTALVERFAHRMVQAPSEVSGEGRLFQPVERLTYRELLARQARLFRASVGAAGPPYRGFRWR